jgi:hypothetical protein
LPSRSAGERARRARDGRDQHTDVEAGSARDLDRAVFDTLRSARELQTGLGLARGDIIAEGVRGRVDEFMKPSPSRPGEDRAKIGSPLLHREL